MTGQRCPECEASWDEGKTCQDDFHQMLFWEAENPVNWEVHHLMVLCYYLQHPSYYSPQGLSWAVLLLKDFVVHQISVEEVRRRTQEQVSSDRRTWRIKGSPGDLGAYRNPVSWTFRAQDVVSAGSENYVASVRHWGDATLDALTASGNLKPD